jgi:hypothetical protein
MRKLTIKEQATNFATMQHILQVQKALQKIIVALLDRGRTHDRSKLETPEVEYFAKYTEELKNLTYNSKEYQECLDKMEPAITHHYANNRHHPQSHANGVDDMNLVDICEMVADWAASSKRQYDGNIRLSLEESCKRFNIEPQLANILRNTLDLFDEEIN